MSVDAKQRFPPMLRQEMSQQKRKLRCDK